MVSRMMAWAHFLFSRKGRIGRLPYCLSLLGLLGILGVVAGLADAIDRASGPYAPPALRAAFWAALAIALLGLGLLTPIGIKRLHDRDKSGLWLGVFYVLPALLEVSEQRGRAAAMIALVSWAALELCCLRGTPGTNRYGSAPGGLASLRFRARPDRAERQ
jgi:uncharacterized membrane protein YhaH (DUF805 family)